MLIKASIFFVLENYAFCGSAWPGRQLFRRAAWPRGSRVRALHALYDVLERATVPDLLEVRLHKALEVLQRHVLRKSLQI